MENEIRPLNRQNLGFLMSPCGSNVSLWILMIAFVVIFEDFLFLFV